MKRTSVPSLNGYAALGLSAPDWVLGMEGLVRNARLADSNVWMEVSPTALPCVSEIGKS